MAPVDNPVVDCDFDQYAAGVEDPPSDIATTTLDVADVLLGLVDVVGVCMPCEELAAETADEDTAGITRIKLSTVI
jgi:hypothetical protein